MHDGTPDTPARGGHYGFLDALRGLSCLWVVLNHVKIPDLQEQLPHQVWLWGFHHGATGVIVFFVLSGFVISSSVDRVTFDGRSASRFALRRLLRLTPPYYASIVAALVISVTSDFVKNDPVAFPTPGQLLAHLFYLPGVLRMPVINGVYWTLFLEVQFYVVFGLLWWLVGRTGGLTDRRARLVLVVAACGTLIWPIGNFNFFIEPFFWGYAYSFLGGALLYWAYRGSIPWAPVGVFYAVLAVAWVWHGERLVGAAVITGALLALAIRRDGLNRWLTQAPFQFAGKVSYSLYLIHAPVIGVVVWAGVELLGQSARTDALLIVPSMAASVIAGWVLWRLFEQPAIRWSKRLKASPATAPAR
jgi:peptidoglycan/LPS O-acetylase OafA/YrhL